MQGDRRVQAPEKRDGVRYPPAAFSAEPWIGSGILPIAANTRRICLAMRSRLVQAGCRWGTIGGERQANLSLAESAVRELREETGYAGSIRLHPAYTFQRGPLEYHNFVGVVPAEFDLDAAPAHAWENDRLRWFYVDELYAELRTRSSSFHFGVPPLLQHSRGLIAQLTGARRKRLSSSASDGAGAG